MKWQNYSKAVQCVKTPKARSQALVISPEVMGINYPHECSFVVTHRSMVKAGPNTEWHSRAKKTSHAVSPLLGHLHMLCAPPSTTPPHSHTLPHSQGVRLSTCKAGILRLGPQDVLARDKHTCIPWSSCGFYELPCPSLNCFCQCAGKNRPEFIP